MAAEFENVELSEFIAAGELQKIDDAPLRLRFDRKEKDEALLFQKGNLECHLVILAFSPHFSFELGLLTLNRHWFFTT